jgi:hypothetical protein
MHKNATKYNEILSKWCKNKHGASQIIDTFGTYHTRMAMQTLEGGFLPRVPNHGVVVHRARQHALNGRVAAHQYATSSTNEAILHREIPHTSVLALNLGQKVLNWGVLLIGGHDLC